ncbi:type I 3-dehydroquinate dehydratase [Actinophytocola sp.]|uniref:type I 3-dehydroquinate dehydratase n=1 Tax=Actinophytocola sp. TaxID=1872138 RepID=UPI003899D521
MRRNCAIVATLTTAAWRERRDLRALRGIANGLQVRADLTGDSDVDLLRSLFDGELIYSLRSPEYGGAFIGSAAERQQCLLAAARSYDVVELEVDRDLTPELLAAVPPHRRRICWYGEALDPSGFGAIFERMRNTPARLYLLASEATTVAQAMDPLRFLAGLGRSDVTAFATGDLGLFTRLLAPWFGAPVVFGGLGQDVAWGVPPVAHLLDDYPFPDLPPLEQVFGIVSRPMRGSQSPRLHNAGYRALGLSALYLPLPVKEFTGSWQALCTGFEQLGITFGGATVVSPFKEEALLLSDTASVAARSTDAANLLVREGSGWRACTTDPAGVVGALRRAGVGLTGRRAAVVGCGGAGRGAVLGLSAAGAVPTIVNRGLDRARYAADLLGVDYLPLNRFAPENYSLIVHATPVRDEPPFAIDRIAPGTVVVDLIYGPAETTLAAAVRARQQVVVDGWQVLGVEVDRQFRLLTGRSLPGEREPLDGAEIPIPVVPEQRESVI